MIAGRYSLEREIGRGGMGAVWLARDEVLNRTVALKRVGAMPEGPDPDLTRAEREARLSASLNHPHVVAVFDLLHEENQHWLVMEYVAGESLGDLLRRDGALSADRAAALLRQAAEALAAAHEAGIVHRDVKPSNLLVTAEDRVKIADFGIARATADAALTQTGLVTGSPAYLAPEVATGKPATDRSDVWSLGATLFHALAGHPPYDAGDNVLTTMYRIVNETPPRLADAGWLAPVLEATMATDPAHRWSMREVAAFLAGGPTAEAPTATTPAAPRSVPAPPPRTEAPASAAGVVEEPEPNDSTTQRSHRARRAGPSPVLLVLLGAAVAAVAGLVIWQMLGASPQETPLAGSPSSEATAEPTETASSTDSESPSAPESSEDEAADTAAQEEAMEEFISDYLTTVTSDPEATWQQLTPAFRRQSGGFQGYTGYWDTIAEARVLDISADAEAQPATVTYSVQYTRQNGSTFTDVVTLELRKSDNSFLISGES